MILRYKNVILFSVSFVILGLGVGLTAWSSATYFILDGVPLRFLIFAIPLALLYIFGTLKKYFSSWKSFFLKGIFGVITLAAFSTLAVGLETVLNARLDSALSQTHKSTVIGIERLKVKVESRRPMVSFTGKYLPPRQRKPIKKTLRSQLLLVKSWRENKELERIHVTPEEASTVIPHETKMTIITKPGFFGDEWVVSYQIH